MVEREADTTTTRIENSLIFRAEYQSTAKEQN